MSGEEKSRVDKSLRETVSVIEEEAKPKFHSENVGGGGDHQSNLQIFRQTATSNGSDLGELLDQKKASAWIKEGPVKSLDFSTAYARFRDYKTRYGTALWQRQKGWAARKRSWFSRGVFYTVGSGGSQ